MAEEEEELERKIPEKSLSLCQQIFNAPIPVTSAPAPAPAAFHFTR